MIRISDFVTRRRFRNDTSFSAVVIAYAFCAVRTSVSRNPSNVRIRLFRLFSRDRRKANERRRRRVMSLRLRAFGLTGLLVCARRNERARGTARTENSRLGRSFSSHAASLPPGPWVLPRRYVYETCTTIKHYAQRLSFPLIAVVFARRRDAALPWRTRSGFPPSGERTSPRRAYYVLYIMYGSVLVVATTALDDDEDVGFKTYGTYY